MIDIITIKYCKTKIGREVSCYYSPLYLKRMMTLILSVTLIITLLIFALGSQSAFSQCDELCLYEQNAPQTKISSAGAGAGYRESATAYLEPKGMTRLNRDLLVSGVYEVSNEQNSGIFASDRISVSHELSDEAALNEMDRTGTAGEDSSGNLYAANDAGANSSPHTSSPKDWEFILIPYAWLTGINGSVTVRGRSADVDEGFLDLVKNLDIAAMFHGEVWWKGKFGGFVDTVFARLSDTKDVTLRHFRSINLKLVSTLFLQEIGGLYRVGTWPVGSPYNKFVQKSKPSVTLDLLAGGRFWRLNNELDIHGSRGILPGEIEQSQNWFDFIVGGRAILYFYKKLFLDVRSDIGGFGASFSSKISWNIVAAIGYELPWYRITPVIGYRALYDNFSTESGNLRFENKIWLHGPVLGVAFRF